MAMVVQKYGGSSVADIERLGHVADKVVAAKRAGDDVVVTVSAMGKTTDSLIALARAAASYQGVALDPPRRELDMLVSTGERVSIALLSIAIGARGEKAISFTGSQSGIITTDRHFDARIVEVRPHRIENELARGAIVIVAGYQGVSDKLEITTLGRGGTDTTAVALAAALGAERCEIYSDVDGVYSADPRTVAEAAHLPTLDYATVQEMAECGAKVINAQAVEWAKKANVKLHARSTFDPWERGAGHRQTVIGGARATASAAAVVGEANLVQGRLHGDAAAFSHFVTRAAEQGVPLRDVAFGPGGATFVVPLLNVPDWGRARAELLAAAGTALELREGLSGVSVVGDGLSTTGGPFVRFLRRVGNEARAVYATALRLTALVEPASAAALQCSLHDEFIGTDRRRALS